ncbi:hypothetical protein [Arthrobacter sp. 260]|uniref:hypothetical protein n=1 Tax=Arthrobacter sp. 260 TaxID=2735314 RepID=UPI001491619F|nr:hypothetical protein [Arthrobacter sp. 260]NOJ59797.1 hypothetical protein [Arthrobacter sp. 260]
MGEILENALSSCRYRRRAQFAGALIGLIVLSGCGAEVDEASPPESTATSFSSASHPETKAAATPPDAEIAAVEDSTTSPAAPDETSAAEVPAGEKELGRASVVTFSSPEPSGPAGATTGKLVEKEGCLLIRLPDGQELLPLFRAESEPGWANGQLTFDGITYPAGATLVFGGGDLPPNEIDIPDTCSDVETWFTFMVLQD